MPINGAVTTANYEDNTLSKPNARIFTLTVQNQPVMIQLNVPPFGTGENWVPIGGIRLDPGYWVFNAEDFAEYGVDRASGVRVRAFDAASPGIVTVI